MVKLVIFDFDGVIANSMQLIADVANKVGSEFNIPHMTVESLRAKPMKELLRDRNVTIEEGLKSVVAIQNEAAKLFDTVEIFPDVKELIPNFALKYKLCVLSNNRKFVIEPFLEKHDLLKYFDDVYALEGTFNKNTLIDSIVTKYSLKLEDIFMIGDELGDIEVARKSGIWICSVTWGFDCRETLENGKPDFLVDNVSELKELLF